MQPSVSQTFLQFSNPRFVDARNRTLCIRDGDAGEVLTIKRLPGMTESHFSAFQETRRMKFPALARSFGLLKLDSGTTTYFASEFYARGGMRPDSLTPTDRSLSVFALASGLNFLHQNGIVHGHVYPSNILFGGNDEPVVCDFGWHCVHENDAAFLLAAGKGSYVAPEYLLGGPLKTSCDVYSFGMLLHAIVSGKDLGPCDWVCASRRYMGERPEPAGNEFYRKLMERCWNADPGKRPSMAEVVSLICQDDSFVFEGTDMEILGTFQKKVYPNGFPIAEHVSKPLKLLPSLTVGNKEVIWRFLAVNEGIRESMPPYIIRQKNYHDINNPRKLCQSKSAKKVEEIVRSRLSEESSDVEEDIVPKKVDTPTQKKKNAKKEAKKPRPQPEVKVSLKAVADSGNVEGQFQYGILLRQGDSEVSVNLAEGAKYIKLAADSGLLKAQRLFSRMARDGEGMAENRKVSAHYMKLAAQSGDLECQLEYAMMLETGACGNVNMKDAARYFRLAALQGNAVAQRRLAGFLEIGRGVAKDVIEAVKFYKMAAGQGDGEAQFRLAKLLPGEEGSQYMLVSAENGIAEAQTEYGRLIIRKDFARGSDYLKRAIAQGNSDAMYYLGVAIYYGDDLDRRISGLEYIREASEKRNSKAMFQYGLILTHLDYVAEDSIYELVQAASSRDEHFTDWPLLDIGVTIEQICEEGPSWIENAANSGLAEAQYFMGVMLQFGEGGLEIDLNDALKYYKMAADQGHIRAQLYVALMLDDGRGSVQNLREAAKYYRMAADRGDPTAQVNYGFMLFDGRGVARNRKEAARYFTSCADNGYVLAQYKYALMCYNGQGIPRNLRLAVKYFQKVVFDKEKRTSKLFRHANEVSQVQMIHESARCIRAAAEQNCVEAQQVYAWMLMSGEIFPKDVTEAMRNFRRAADKGDAISQHCLALYISSTTHGRKEIEEASGYFKMSADQGYSHAQFQYGLMLDNGDGVVRNFAEAARYYKMAADQGVSQAQICIANMYENGEGMPIDMVESAKYYRLAAKQGEATALLRYGKILQEGLGVQMDTNKAFKYLLKAASMRSGQAQLEVARAYENGIGVAKDIKQAAKYYEMAARQPNMHEAQLRYADMLRIGEGVWRNWGEATKFYRMSCNNIGAPSTWFRGQMLTFLKWFQRIMSILCLLYYMFFR